MPSRKRPLEDVDTEESTSLTDMLSRIRNTWQFANLMQYIYLFGNALKIDNELDVELLEEECVKPGNSEKLSQLGLTLLKWVSSHRGLTLDIFDEYTRRQYLAKAPERNPFGEEEEAFKFSEFDIFAKLKVLHQLSVWTLNNPDRIKERMEDRDETNWRIEPLGWDRQGRTYILLDDNRLYRMTHPPSVTPKPKPKSKAKSSKSKRNSKRQKLSNCEDEDGEHYASDAEEVRLHHESNDDGLGGAKWECLAITLEDYQGVLDSIKSKDEDEQVLTQRIIDDILPDIEKAADARTRREAKRMRELENVQKLASAKRSSRIADKTAKQKEVEDAVDAERKRKEQTAMAHREADKQRKMEDARESRMMTREQRLRDREMRRILQEEELANLEQSSSHQGSENGERRVSGRQQQADLEVKRKEAERLKRELSEADDHWDFDCAICGAHGKDLDDGTHSIACDKCGVWQHSTCHGIQESDADREDFHFVCDRCNKVNSIKLHLSGGKRTSPDAPTTLTNPSIITPKPGPTLSNAPNRRHLAQPHSSKPSNSYRISPATQNHHDVYLARSQGQISNSTSSKTPLTNGSAQMSQQPHLSPSRQYNQAQHNPYLNNFIRQPTHPQTQPQHTPTPSSSKPLVQNPPSTPSLAATQGSTDVRFSPTHHPLPGTGTSPHGTLHSSPNAPSYTPNSSFPNPSAYSPMKQYQGSPGPSNASVASAIATVSSPNQQPPLPLSSSMSIPGAASGILPIKHESPENAQAVASLPTGAPSLSPSVNVGGDGGGIPVKKLTPQKEESGVGLGLFNSDHKTGRLGEGILESK